MSIYSALSMDVPVIIYSALHQMDKGGGEKQYTKTIQDLHTMMRAETAKVGDVWQSHLQDIAASSIQTMRGNLSQFLTLPLDTDVKEIHRIFEDQIAHLTNQTLPVTKFGLLTSTEGRFFWEKEQNATLQRLWQQGSDYLKKLKFRMQESGHFICESDFFVESGLNLDVLEHIVRDRMGIYATAHGQHIRQTDAFVFAAHNLVVLHGSLERGEANYEADLHFAKGKSQYLPFRKTLSELLDAVKSGADATHCSLWQRKLGLGAGAEFNIRIRVRERRSLRDALNVLTKGAEKNPVSASVVKTGALLVKELSL